MFMYRQVQEIMKRRCQHRERLPAKVAAGKRIFENGNPFGDKEG
jgi:hypothetical protein